MHIANDIKMFAEILPYKRTFSINYFGKHCSIRMFLSESLKSAGNTMFYKLKTRVVHESKRKKKKYYKCCRFVSKV